MASRMAPRVATSRHFASRHIAARSTSPSGGSGGSVPGVGSIRMAVDIHAVVAPSSSRLASFAPTSSGAARTTRNFARVRTPRNGRAAARQTSQCARAAVGGPDRLRAARWTRPFWIARPRSRRALLVRTMAGELRSTVVWLRSGKWLETVWRGGGWRRCVLRCRCLVERECAFPAHRRVCERRLDEERVRQRVSRKIEDPDEGTRGARVCKHALQRQREAKCVTALDAECERARGTDEYTTGAPR